MTVPPTRSHATRSRAGIPPGWRATPGLDFVAAAMVRARKEAGLTQQQVANITRYTLSYLSAIERSRRRPTRDLMQRLDELFDTGGSFTFMHDELLAREYVTPKRMPGGWEDLDAAQMLRCWHPDIVPAVARTAAYDAAVAGHAPPRHMQPGLIVDRDPARDSVVLIGETALARPVGGPQVMAEQCRHLIEISQQRPGVIVRVVPVSAGMHVGLLAGFTLVDFHGKLADTHRTLSELGDIPSLVVLDGWYGGIIDGQPVFEYMRIWEQISAVALSADRSAKMIESRAQRWLSVGTSQ